MRSVAAALATLTPMIASAGSLPVFGGLTYSASTTSGYIVAGGVSQAQDGVTNAGYAVGTANPAGPSSAGVGRRVQAWTPSSAVALPGITANGDSSSMMYATAVNSSNTVVGNFTPLHPEQPSSFGNRAFRYLDGVQQKLGDLGTTSAGFAYTSVYGLNTAGVSVGSSAKYSGTAGLGARAVLWKANGTIANELESLGANANGYVASEANDISDSSVIVGDSQVYVANKDFGTRPVRWNISGTIKELGIFNTNSQGYCQASAIGVNKAGVILGKVNKYAADDSWRQKPVRYAPNSTYATQLFGLGVEANGTDAQAYASAISDSGLILGQSNVYFGSVQIGTRPVYWTTSGSNAAVELPNLGTQNGVTYGEAESANASGVIAGTCRKFVNNTFVRDSAVIWTTAGGNAVIDLNSRLPAISPWTLTEARSISDTGFVSGVGDYAAGGNGGTYQRAFSMLVPEAGTYGRGDANFDTHIDFADLLLLAQHFNMSNPSVALDVADFNLDGQTNFTDLLSLAQHFQNGGLNADGSLSSDFASEWALAQSITPEPTALLALASGATLLGRRRRQG